MTKAKISLALFCIVAVLITSTAIADSAKRSSVTAPSMAGVTNEERITFLTEKGWEIVANPVEIKEITVPKEFDAVYTEYNNIQKSVGMNLETVKGKTVKRFSYEVLNYPDAAEANVIANLIVYNGKIVGGDISSTSLDGFMHGITDITTVKTALLERPE
jgi:SRSO17 transposase